VPPAARRYPSLLSPKATKAHVRRRQSKTSRSPPIDVTPHRPTGLVGGHRFCIHQIERRQALRAASPKHGPVATPTRFVRRGMGRRRRAARLRADHAQSKSTMIIQLNPIALQLSGRAPTYSLCTSTTALIAPAICGETCITARPLGTSTCQHIDFAAAAVAHSTGATSTSPPFRKQASADQVAFCGGRLHPLHLLNFRCG
jgi:hypothetical protein